MKTQTDTRKRKQINEKRLAAYTAAAGAALLAAGPADAAVQYSGVKDITVQTNYPSALIDIDGNGSDDLNFWGIGNHSGPRTRVGSYVYDHFNISGGFSNLNAVSFAGASGFPSNVGQGSIIGASDNWVNNNGILFSGNLTAVNYSSGCAFYGFQCWPVDSVNNGNFTRGNPGYLGIRFDPGDGTKYGWIHVASVERNQSYSGTSLMMYYYYEYKIDGWAYDDSGQAIAAGQTVVPEPTSVALFAAGAATIMAKRRMKKK